MIGRRRSARTLALAAACVCALLGVGAGAQPQKPDSPQADSSTAPAQDGLGRTTPRGTVLGFLNAARKGDMETAVRYLNTDLRGNGALTLARRLFTVLDTGLSAHIAQISADPDGAGASAPRPNQSLIGVIARDEDALNIIVERVNRGQEGWVWLFSHATLDAVPEVFHEISRVSIESALPDFLVNIRVADVRLFEWIAILLLIPLFYFFTVSLNELLIRASMLFRRGAHASDRPSSLVPVPVRLLSFAFATRWILTAVRLPILTRQFWAGASMLTATAAIVWLLIAANGHCEQYIVRRVRSTDRFGAPLIHVIRRGVDVLIVVVAVVALVQRFGVNPMPALAGLGVGGIAVALAAQKTLENVVGGISLIADRALRVGDTLNIGGTVGTVDYIGLRSTRIRTLDRTLVSVPNGQIAAMTLEALSARDIFWFHPVIGLHPRTSAEQVRTVMDGTLEMLLGHSLIDRTSVHVRFYRLGTASFDVEVFAYVAAADWADFLGVQEHLLLGIVDIVRRAGTSIAFQPQIVAHEPRPFLVARDEDAIRKGA